MVEQTPGNENAAMRSSRVLAVAELSRILSYLIINFFVTDFLSSFIVTK